MVKDKKDGERIEDVVKELYKGINII